ncbi:MAG: peptidylprolyl isomerase [Candidatus Zixiibacteriota bacterium]
MNDFSDFIVAKADNDFNYTAVDFYRRLLGSTLLGTGGYVEPADLKRVLDSLVLDSLTGFEADKIDLSNYYYDNWTFKLRYHDYLTQVFIYEKIYSQIEADSVEIINFYEAHPDLFAVEEQLELSHIFLSKIGLKNSKDSLYYKSLSEEELERELAAYTDKIYRMLVYGEPFGVVASEYTHDQLSRRGAGYVGWTTRGIYVHPFDSVAFSLKPGEFSVPYQDKDGWHIVYMNDYIPAGLMPLSRAGVLDAVRDSYMTYMSKERSRILMDSLARDINILANKDIMDTNIYDIADSVWAGIVNGKDTIDVKEMKNIEHVYRRKFRTNNTTPEMKYQMLDEISRRYVIIEAAEEAGYDTLPRVIEERERLRHVTAKSIIEKSVYDVSWSPSEEKVREYYDTHIDDFVVKRPNHVQYLLTGDSLFAEFLRDQALSGLSFEDILKADYVKQSKFKVKLVDLGYIGGDYKDSAFYREASVTPLLGISKPYPSDEGYLLIKIIDRKQSFNYNQSRGQIITLLTQKYRADKRQEFQDRLFAEYHVTFPKELKKVHLKPYQFRAQQ